MNSIVITPVTTPVINEPTSCNITITKMDGTVEVYPVVFPANMLTIISNPPSLEMYATKANVKIALASLDEHITNMTDRVEKALDTLPLPVNTDSFIKKTDLGDETKAREDNDKQLSDTLSNYKTTVIGWKNTIVEAIDDSKDTISKVSDSVKAIEKSLEDLKTSSSSYITTDGKVISLSLDDDNNVLVNKDLTLVSTSQLDALEKKINSTIEDKVTSITEDYKVLITALEEKLIASNKLLTATIKGLSDGSIDSSTTTNSSTDNKEVVSDPYTLSVDDLNMSLLSLSRKFKRV